MFCICFLMSVCVPEGHTTTAISIILLYCVVYVSYLLMIINLVRIIVLCMLSERVVFSWLIVLQYFMLRIVVCELSLYFVCEPTEYHMQ